ncbi:MAG: adenylate/guanylate cyclase domain-containing response regulator [Betaproteobacteria bacterium]|nr:MAG: adenylate/guanylate cyclase domain-containing response regulator [Betaproteobacteria bacterium]
MGTPARILVVDDLPANVKLLADLLTVKGYSVATATSGEEALAQLASEHLDLVLLDVMMPGISGYDVCRAIRADPALGILPVVLVTSLDPGQERIKGLEAGADDFLTKPVNQAELLARVKSLLRIKSLYDEVERRKLELAEWNRTLEQRVADGIAQLERLSRMKRFFSPQVADLILAGGTDDPLRSHRREITVVFLDLRGFTAFTETADPEEVMGALREYHAEMGRLIMAHQGTLERFAGDGIMIFFNDPVELENPAEKAVRMAIEMHGRFALLDARWRKRGYDLHMGIGIAQGYATLGAIGFEGRQDYGAIGTVTNLAARLCAEAAPGQILVSQRVLGQIEELVQFEPVDQIVLKGFRQPVQVFNVSALKQAQGGTWTVGVGWTSAADSCKPTRCGSIDGTSMR